MPTDIDRLHDVIEERVGGRGCGKTFAVCHILAGLIELGRCDHIHVLVTVYRDIEHILPMLWRTCDEYGIEIRRTCRYGERLAATPSWSSIIRGPSDVTLRFYPETNDRFTPGHFPMIDARRDAVGDWIDYEEWRESYEDHKQGLRCAAILKKATSVRPNHFRDRYLNPQLHDPRSDPPNWE